MEDAVYTPAERRSPRRRRRAIPWGAILLLAVGFALGFWAGLGAGGGGGGEEASPKGGGFLSILGPKAPPETPDWVTEDLIPVNEFSRPGLELGEINGIVVHYVGNPGTTAQNNRNYFAALAETGEAYASAHYVIGLEGEILQCVPLDEVAYCSNSRNEDTISIECCHPDEGGAFNQSTYDSLVRLTAFLADYYGLEEEQIIRHYDVTGKLCPKYYAEHEDAWLRFRQEVFSR